jgi:iron complex transport system permease protein
LLSFLAGGGLAVSGLVFQSVLKNPLASPYLLGISAGASLGAGLVMLSGFALLGMWTLPAAGFAFGFGTLVIVLSFSAALDRNMANHTIILFGMVFSLFLNAILTILAGLYREELKNLLYWQMGSFALKSWNYVVIMLPCVAAGAAGILLHTRELDALSFGEEEAAALGVEVKKVRLRLLCFSSLMTGAIVALSGAIGFIDLIAPHMARKLVGSRTKYAFPMCFLLGGGLLTLTDLVARTVVSPLELPVGAVTAIIGAPFFAWIYFRR